MSRGLFVGLFAALAVYADVSGKWVGTSEKADPAGKTHREAIYLQLRQSGNNLTGVIGSQGAQEFEISQGKIDGNQVSFVVQPQGSEPWSFRLIVSADSMMGENIAMEEGKVVKGRVELKRQ
jgi:hypothetical protein